MRQPHVRGFPHRRRWDSCNPETPLWSALNSGDRNFGGLGLHPHYGADYIHTIRSYSVPFAQAIADQVADQWDQSWPTIRASSYDGSAVVSTDGEPITTGHGYRGYVTLGDLINEKLGETDARTVELITA